MSSPVAEPSPRFVVQHHTGHGEDHFDFMLEHGDVLWTWRLRSPPPHGPGARVAARRIADHRPAYLTYEGPISRGRGRCRIVDRGAYRLLDRSAERLRIELNGRSGTGLFELTRDPAGPPDRWTLTRLSPADGPAS